MQSGSRAMLAVRRASGSFQEGTSSFSGREKEKREKREKHRAGWRRTSGHPIHRIRPDLYARPQDFLSSTSGYSVTRLRSRSDRDTFSFGLRNEPRPWVQVSVFLEVRFLQEMIPCGIEVGNGEALTVHGSRLKVSFSVHKIPCPTLRFLYQI